MTQEPTAKNYRKIGPPWTELNVDALSDCLSGRNWAPLRIGVGLVTGKLNVEITFSDGTWNFALFQCAYGHIL